MEERTEAGGRPVYPPMDEVTLKFGKGCVGEEFRGRDGIQYREILVPNPDRSDTRPWQTFVVKSNHVHENQFGKGMWCKLPADGSTTLNRNMNAGQDEHGQPVWYVKKTQVPNRELKKMVESYKERGSMKDRLSEKKTEAAQINSAARAAGKDRSRDAAL